MIILKKDLPYKILLDAFQALGRGKTLEESKLLIPKGLDIRNALLNEIRTKDDVYPGALKIFVHSARLPPSKFNSTHITVALRLLKNILQYGSPSVVAEPTEISDFQFSDMQLEALITFGLEIGFMNINVDQQLEYVRQWKWGAETRDSFEMLPIKNFKTQTIASISMIEFIRFLLSIMNLQEPNDIQNVYNTRLNKLNESKSFLEEYFDTEESIEEVKIIKKDDLDSLKSETPFLFEFNIDECVRVFESIVDSLPSNVTFINVVTDKAWPRKGLLNALNNRGKGKLGCVAIILDKIETISAQLSTKQRDALLGVSLRVGAYNPNTKRFVQGWGGIEKNGKMELAPSNLLIAAKSSRQFHVTPIRQLSQAWIYLAMAIKRIGQNDDIDQILGQLDKIQFTMDRPLFDTNGIFIGTTTSDFTTQEQLQHSRIVKKLLNSPIFSMFEHIRKNPEILESFKKIIPEESWEEIGLVKRYQGRLIFSTGITAYGAHDTSSDFVLRHVLPGDEYESFEMDNNHLSNLSERYDFVENTMITLLK